MKNKYYELAALLYKQDSKKSLPLVAECMAKSKGEEFNKFVGLLGEKALPLLYEKAPDRAKPLILDRLFELNEDLFSSDSEYNKLAEIVGLL